MTVLLTGGTGTLGTLVLPRLRTALGPEEVRVLSRRPGPGVAVGDLSSGAGVLEAMTGVRTVVHCAGGRSGDVDKAHVLVSAARTAGVGHVATISVVGCDRIAVRGPTDRALLSYYADQHAAERALEGSGLGWTVLRATQFHPFVLRVLTSLSRAPVVPVPAGWRVQPVDAGEVAARLVELALAGPAGRVADLGGPHVHDLGDLARDVLRVTGRRRPLVRPHLRGPGARSVADGALLVPDRAVGGRTWTQFLAARFPS